MSKFGSMNNFQLTREAYNLKERVNDTENKITEIKEKTDELVNTVFEVNELKIKEFVEIMDKSVDAIVLKKRMDILEQKLQKSKMYSIQISNEEKEKLQTFLNEEGLSDFYSALIELGVRNVEDILFLVESDLTPYGLSVVSIRKCLNSAKSYVETNQM